jgi:prefoldin subunit 5
MTDAPLSKKINEQLSQGPSIERKINYLEEQAGVLRSKIEELEKRIDTILLPSPPYSPYFSR